MPEPRTHVFIIDGTLSRLDEGRESNAGLLYKLLTEERRADQTVGYDPGIQGEGLRKWIDVASGYTINQSIEHGYAALASRYEPGDKIMLFGYSRGAYAARSLAGFIGAVGLLRKRHATQRRVHRAFRYYEAPVLSAAGRAFANAYCHGNVAVEMIGVWDTVRALGLPYPVLSRLAPMATEFHNHKLGDHVRNAFQALALDETRTAYSPLPWKLQPDWQGHLEQSWFAGAHADVGGQVDRQPLARPLANIALMWMLERAEMCGLILPEGWRARFETDPLAPMVGTKRGPARYFLIRAPRDAGACGSETQHPSVDARMEGIPRYRPKARWISAAESRTAQPAPRSPPG